MAGGVSSPGSGPTDRYGNSAFAKRDAIKQLGAAFRAAGFVCLRIDKRGVGASATAVAKEDDFRLTTYLDDVAAWVTRPHADKRFTKVGVVGHSEGSLFGLCRPGRSSTRSCRLCGPGRRLAVCLREQLRANVSKEIAEKA